MTCASRRNRRRNSPTRSCSLERIAPAVFEDRHEHGCRGTARPRSRDAQGERIASAASPNAVEAPARAGDADRWQGRSASGKTSRWWWPMSAPSHGVKVGMPFQVIRGTTSHRQRAGGRRSRENRRRPSIQNLTSEKDRIKVGDRLKVDATGRPNHDLARNTIILTQAT